MNKDYKMLEKLFFKLLPVQIFIVAMGAVNSIVDGAIAGRFLDAATVGVVGLFYPMVNLVNAVASVLLGGSAVLCGRFMGSGETDKTQGVFSLNITCSFIVGGVVSLACLIFPGALSQVLGATPELKQLLMNYITGMAIGIIPMVLAQQISSFLQLERKTGLGYAGIAGMIISNITLDILLVAVFNLGVWGLALATSISNWIYLLILSSHYIFGKPQLKYNIKSIFWSILPELVKIGFPGALLVLCLGIRGVVLNIIVLKYGGGDALSALASTNMLNGLFMAYCLGNGAVVRMLGSVFIGEQDRDSIKNLITIVSTKGLLMACAVGGVIALFSAPLAQVFFPDKGSTVYSMAHTLFIIYAACIPLIHICQICTNYLQAAGHNMYINFLSVFDGFISMISLSLLLAPFFGISGVWAAIPIGIILTVLTTPAYDLVFWKRIPKNTDEWLFITEDFGVADSDRLDIEVTGIEQVTDTANKVQEFCNEHGVGKKAAYFASLSVEEMAGNVVMHGFHGDNKKHYLDIKVIYKNGDISIRLKDDCIPFDPKEREKMVSEEDPFKNIGIRMIMKIADEVTYQNMLGLNVLTILIKNKCFGEV